jgi:hypothetical protein
MRTSLCFRTVTSGEQPQLIWAQGTHYKRAPLLEYVLSALLKLLQKGAPFMTSAKYIGRDVHTESISIA